jgi:hypothetical protein
MGNTFEFQCHLEVGLFYNYKHFSVLHWALLDEDYCFIAVAVVEIGPTGNPRHIPLPNDNNAIRYCG